MGVAELVDMRSAEECRLNPGSSFMGRTACWGFCLFFLLRSKTAGGIVGEECEMVKVGLMPPAVFEIGSRTVA